MAKPLDLQDRKQGPLPHTPGEAGFKEPSKCSPIHDEMTQAKRMRLLEQQQQQQQQLHHHQHHGQQTNPMDCPNPSQSFESVDDQLRKTQIELDKAVEALASLHSTDPFREGDDKIARKMKELRHDIRQWSRNFNPESKKSGLATKFREAIRSSDNDSPFCAVTFKWRHYLAPDKETGLSLLVQAYVWKQLHDEVFDSFLWLGGPCKVTPSAGLSKPCQIRESFRVLEAWCGSSEIASRDQHYHQWRAQTTRLLANSPRLRLHQPCIDHNVKSITKAIASKLKDYTDKKDMFGDHEANPGSDNLASIVRTAVALDLLFWQQKACFNLRVWYPKYSQGVPRNEPPRFRADWMTSDLSDRHDEALMQERGGPYTANIFTTPALFKNGTSDGDRYDDEVVLCKAVVDCMVTFQ